ncbi:hypothetical protein [Prochlorococcus sp. MIT 1307]|nr:hypothetical protein [Prochlorococcus sp. MIT 1307]
MKDLSLVEEVDNVDSYFECISSCSLDAEGVECVTRCVEVHLKEES